MTTSVWIYLGFLGQALFGLRFLIQWWASEKHGASIIPDAFWYTSIPAAAVLLSYAIWREDPVFIINEALCLAIFIRNVTLLKRKKNP